MKHIISLKKAAKKWDGGLPLGNGRLGATVLGKINEEWITINEESLWYGPYRDRKNPDALENIEKIRRLLLDGEVQKAQFLAKMALTSTPKYMNPYQPAGELKIVFLNHLAKRTGNRKCFLDLDEALAHVDYDMGGVSYQREHLVSEDYQVLAVHLTASEPGTLTICANMNRKPFEEYSEKLDEKTVCNYGENGVGGVHYFTGVRMCAKAPGFRRWEILSMWKRRTRLPFMWTARRILMAIQIIRKAFWPIWMRRKRPVMRRLRKPMKRLGTACMTGWSLP